MDITPIIIIIRLLAALGVAVPAVDEVPPPPPEPTYAVSNVETGASGEATQAPPTSELPPPLPPALESPVVGVLPVGEPRPLFVCVIDDAGHTVTFDDPALAADLFIDGRGCSTISATPPGITCVIDDANGSTCSP